MARKKKWTCNASILTDLARFVGSRRDAVGKMMCELKVRSDVMMADLTSESG
jgi:hypothetical protein